MCGPVLLFQSNQSPQQTICRQPAANKRLERVGKPSQHNNLVPHLMSFRLVDQCMSEAHVTLLSIQLVFGRHCGGVWISAYLILLPRKCPHRAGQPELDVVQSKQEIFMSSKSRPT